MRQRRLLGALVVLALLAGAQMGCQRGPSEAERRQAVERQRALERCRRQRGELPERLQRFTAERQGLLALRAEAYRPSPGPKPLDPDEQSRLTIYDQQSEQEQYDQALAAWQEREQGRRAAWRARHQTRLKAAEADFGRAAAALRQVSPALLDGAAVPAIEPAEVARYRHCSPEAFR
jgi:hypothetical protein